MPLVFLLAMSIHALLVQMGQFYRAEKLAAAGHGRDHPDRRAVGHPEAVIAMRGRDPAERAFEAQP